MTPTQKKITSWIAIVFGALGGLAVVGMAAQWWISTEVKSQLKEVEIPDTAQITTDVAAIGATVEAIDGKIDTAIENQQRFEEIFMEYLQNEANR